MSIVDNILALFKKKPSKNKELKVEANEVRCFIIKVPSENYELQVYAFNENDALYQAYTIMKLTSIPDDLTITTTDLIVSANYYSSYTFKNKNNYVKSLNSWESMSAFNTFYGYDK